MDEAALFWGANQISIGCRRVRRAAVALFMSAVTIQESFFGAALQSRRHVTVYLLHGLKVSGMVQSFDKYSLVLETAEQEHLVFKHSITAAFLCRDKKCASCSPSQTAGFEQEAAAGD